MSKKFHKIDYKKFIEDNFLIKNKEGLVVPFVFNETQNYYYDILLSEYPTLQGVRENILKFRQPGFSSLIDGIFTVDFIQSELGNIPVIDSDIYSHKEDEAKVLFDRVSFFLDSYFEASGIKRKDFLDQDSGKLVKGRRGAQIHVQTASAKVSGRGGTKQNIHWSEVAFYGSTEIMDAEKLVTGAEQQVGDGIGKVFRETTGNRVGDFFDLEFQKGLNGIGDFKSRFLAWFIHKEYSKPAPSDWELPEYYNRIVEAYGVTRDQCYWHYKKTSELHELKLREYPTTKEEAFLGLGDHAVFRNTRDSATATPRPPLMNHRYVMGVDLAKVQDFTVITVADAENNNQVYQDRFQTLEWPFQKKRIMEVARHYNNASVILDATGLGDPIADDLSRAGVSITPIKITNELKKEMIEKLSIWIELKKYKFINMEETLLELDNFSYEISSNGRIFYGAREGYHDDIVISHALTVWGLIDPYIEPSEPELPLIRRAYQDMIKPKGHYEEEFEAI